MKNDRLSLDVYIMGVAMVTSLRSACSRRRVGAILVKQGRIISAGYNGSPSGYVNCLKVGDNLDACKCSSVGCIYTIHAEINCLTRAREQGDTLYTTDKPCLSCIKAILSHNSMIRIVYLRDYKDEMRDAFIATLDQQMQVNITQINAQDMKCIHEELREEFDGIYSND